MPSFSGLDEAHVPALQKKYGRNIFESTGIRGPGRILRDLITEPMFIMLMLACIAYFLLGEPREAIWMLAAMGFVTAISLYQEIRSSRALEALRKYSSPQVKVMRGIEWSVIDSEELVPGDLIALEEGELVAADAEILQSNDLSLNESILTGESLPVSKDNRIGHNLLFQGTSINTGQCIARVTETGNRTQLGKLGKSISSISGSKTLLQKQIARFVKRMAFFGILAFLLIWGINYAGNHNLVQSLLFGLTIAMSAVPEEIPVAFSSFMALGAYRMSRLGIITRQPQTIENLGAVSVICLDKTGTITENKMEVQDLLAYRKGEHPDLYPAAPEERFNLLLFARLASEYAPFDAMEKAIVSAFEAEEQSGPYRQHRMIHEYPLGGQPPMMTHVYAWNDVYLAAAKGAPERILRVCKLQPEVAAAIEEAVLQSAKNGYRVLGICTAHTDNDFPAEQDLFDWQFEGLIALYDPPRKDVSKVMDQWYTAGIAIKLLTGDFSGTAMHIARLAGIRFKEAVLTGNEVMQMEEAELRRRVNEVDIFARMFPEAKLKVVDALKANGEIVAMTGDGVNDGPALKSSHVGIAMGGKGTEIAKEAADLILTDDQLDKITQAIRQGRKIYANLKKAVRYIISIHIPIILTASVPLILGWKYGNIFSPIHIIFLELIMGPTCSIFYEREPEEPNSMLQPPRKRSFSLFSWYELWISVLQGGVIAVFLLAVFYFLMRTGYPVNYVRAAVFMTLILNNFFLTFVNRSFEQSVLSSFRNRNNLAPWLLLITLVFVFALSFLYPVQTLFQLEKISNLHFFYCLLISMLSAGWLEIYKYLLRLKTSRH